jgi:hypothetical protein
VESVLDIELLDVSGTNVDSPNDEIGSREQREEVPHQEIDISTTNYQVITEPTPDALISPKTLPPAEKEPEVRPSEHKEEVQEPSIE